MFDNASIILNTMSIWGREFWKSYWIAIQRTTKDKRARSFALRITFLLTYLLAYASLILFVEVNTPTGQVIWEALLTTFIFGSGTIAAIAMRRWHKKENEVLNCSLTAKAVCTPQDAADASLEIRTYLRERALILASLLARAASEVYLEQNRLAPGMQVVTRQIQNALLRENGLWDKLERPERDLANAADGLWSVEQKNQVFTWCEQLRLLRWVIGIDSALIPLAHFPTIDFSLSREVLRQGALQSGKPALKAWDVRVQRDLAWQYAVRVAAEFKARGLIADSPDLESWADEFRAKSLGDSIDYLAGAKTIGELGDDALRVFGSFAYARVNYCSYLVDLLNAAQPFPFSTRKN